MDYVLSNEQMRKADEYTINSLGISGEILMNRAGEKIAEEVILAMQQLNAKSVLVVCGNGNNGGDGYVCAQTLKQRGVSVKVYAFSGNLSTDCNREKARYTGDFANKIEGEIDIIVDCIFGTGLCREVCGEFAQVINKINASNAFVISADIPSGLNGDNGLVLGVAVKANITVAIAEYKFGHFFNDGKDYCGKVIKADIGIKLPCGDYAKLLGDNDIKNIMPIRKQNSNKGTYGIANIIAGSYSFPGAAALSVSAALKSGCGYVYLTCEDFIKNALFPLYPQAIYLNSPNLKANAIAIGMGCGATQTLYESLKNLLKTYNGNLIIDADGLNALSKFGVQILSQKKCNVLLTPHVKEFSRLINKSVEEILTNPIQHANRFANEYGVTVMLKSCTSLLTDGNNIAICTVGNSALAKAGSGDMLSGLCCGIAAQGINLFDSAIISSYLLGVSAEISQREHTAFATTSKEIIKNLSNAFLRLTKQF